MIQQAALLPYYILTSHPFHVNDAKRFLLLSPVIVGAAAARLLLVADDGDTPLLLGRSPLGRGGQFLVANVWDYSV